ncbi:hypothetical protein C8F04DRAFT_1178902 [Mycena alexandri]|uniref:Uncharacterized protein n=1 Tax=Mycena alexandri TaxID=1745969 RepID=A0AAD6X907_9AGAR|nr:hypothetical protein C8F04DRAFT_1178902 [Mycena alexandri]
MSPEIHANDIREIADASSPEIDEKARKELLEMAGTRWKPGGSRDTKLARKKTVGATRGGGSEQSKVTCDLCDISGSYSPESVSSLMQLVEQPRFIQFKEASILLLPGEDARNNLKKILSRVEYDRFRRFSEILKRQIVRGMHNKGISTEILPARWPEPQETTNTVILRLCNKRAL